MSAGEYNYNIIKVRDDNQPIEFARETIDGNQLFRVKENESAQWCPDGTFSVIDLRNRIEPWLTSLFQSEHLSLLVGSGLTTAIQLVSCGTSDNGMGKFEPKSKYANKINMNAAASASAANRGENPNFEDYIRVMCELLRGLEILGEDDDATELKGEIVNAINDFTKNISVIENQIATAPEPKRTDAFNKLVLFLMSFASRTGTRDRLNIGLNQMILITGMYG